MRSRCDRVWAALVEQYGDAIIIEFGATPPDHWRRAIQSLSETEIQHALTRLRKNPPQARPNALEFVELARPPSRRSYSGPLTTDAERREAYFGVKPASRAVVERHLAHMRKVLGSR